VKRDRRMIKGEIILGEPDRFEYKIEETTSATDQQKTLRNSWLATAR
jgi:hypothetical protein